MVNPVVLITAILILAGIIILQIFLSKKDNKWLGLILPIFTFIFSLLIVLGLFFYSTQTITQMQAVSESGSVISALPSTSPLPHSTPLFNAGILILYFLMLNIPTVILLAIYAACRGKRKKQLALEKMRAQDL